MTTLFILAFLAAIGVFMVVDALGPRRPRVSLGAADERPATQRLLDTLFGPAAERVYRLRRGDVDQLKNDLNTRLARAGYPAPFVTAENVLAYQLFTAVLFAVFGGAFALLVGLGPAAPLLMLGLAVMGWTTPLQNIAAAERERREQLTLDAASTMDRLASYVAAGTPLPSAIRSIAERPGGAWVGQFRAIASAYAVGGDFVAALDEAVEKSGRLPDIARVCERLKAAYEMGGGGVTRSLRQMASDARINIRLLITERGYKNAVLMVIPAFFAIIATTLILIAPGAVRMMSVLGG